MEIAKRWIDYYEALAKTRRLKPSEARKLEGHRKAYSLAQSKLEVFRAAGRYARTKKPTDLITLRQAQSRYYEAKAETLPPEKAREVKEKLVPPKKMYDELAKIREDIEEKCKKYRAVKYRTTLATALMPPVERYITMKSLGAALRDDYVRAYELSQKGMGMSELIEHYREMKEAGA
jgi:DNA-directed RNA polymerase subunit F